MVFGLDKIFVVWNTRQTFFFLSSSWRKSHKMPQQQKNVEGFRPLRGRKERKKNEFLLTRKTSTTKNRKN
jgi:hypothetical protein